jgi:hypothetical protein
MDTVGVDVDASPGDEDPTTSKPATAKAAADGSTNLSTALM